MPQTLVDEAKAIVPVCLTPKQRRVYNLAPEPPEWCITGSGNGLDRETDPSKWQPKWPYHISKWKDWLIARRAGKTAPLPSEDLYKYDGDAHVSGADAFFPGRKRALHHERGREALGGFQKD